MGRINYPDDRPTSAEIEADEIENQVWFDLDSECEDHLKAAFAVLGRAPGYRDRYARAQQAIAHAIRILRGLE